jgi:FKBP-type peptidyl-prolyl cis-trans isomerase FklB
MQKSLSTVANVMVATMMLLGNVLAQQTSAATTQPSAPAGNRNTPSLTTQKDKISYAIGMSIGTNLHRQSVEVDPKILQQGLEDALSGSKPLLSEEEARATLAQFQTEMRQKQQEKMQQASAENKKEGDAFLAANKAKEGVVTLPSGLQYKIETAGTGPKPTTSDLVVCNYRGTLIDGKEFDSSYKRGQPATFPVAGVIKGWTEALQLMPVGSKWQLFVPSELAYGERGSGPDIGPNATLIFEVELLSIQSKDQGKENDKK